MHFSVSLGELLSTSLPKVCSLAANVAEGREKSSNPSREPVLLRAGEIVC